MYISQLNTSLPLPAPQGPTHIPTICFLYYFNSLLNRLLTPKLSSQPNFNRVAIVWDVTEVTFLQANFPVASHSSLGKKPDSSRLPSGFPAFSSTSSVILSAVLSTQWQWPLCTALKASNMLSPEGFHFALPSVQNPLLSIPHRGQVSNHLSPYHWGLPLTI